MIRIVTLDEYEAPILKALSKLLYTAFAVGAEHGGTVTVPHGQVEPYDATKLLDTLPKVQAFADDKVLFLTTRKLSPRKLPSGEAPTVGLSRYKGQRAIVTSSVIKSLNPDTVKTLARYAGDRSHLRAAPLPRPALRDVPDVDAVVPARRSQLLRVLP